MTDWFNNSVWSFAFQKLINKMNSGQKNTVEIEEIISLITGHIETYSEQMFPCDIVSSILENLSKMSWIKVNISSLNKALIMRF